jgi:hypothetical protein
MQDEIVSREKGLLKKSREMVAKLPFAKLDLLVVAEIGKDISGLGLDPVVTGRYPSGKFIEQSRGQDIYRIVVLDLTDASMGNASGIGLCDVATRRLVDKINFRSMYTNVITCKGSASARIPMTMDSDREAICVGLMTCKKDPLKAHIAVIKNTSSLEYFLISKPLIHICKQNGGEVVGDALTLLFDEKGSVRLPKHICERR